MRNLESTMRSRHSDTIQTVAVKIRILQLLLSETIQQGRFYSMRHFKSSICITLSLTLSLIPAFPDVGLRKADRIEEKGEQRFAIIFVTSMRLTSFSQNFRNQDKI